MIASAFRAGTGGGKQIEEYLTQRKNREVAPELFRGDMSMTRALIDSSHRRWTYTHGVLAFHTNDNPTDAQLEEITTDFERFMFAGKDIDTFDITWVKHEDKGNVEVHFVVPRTDLETGQDLNIAPPGYDVDWAIWVASINHKYGFTNPFAQSPKVTKGIYREHPDRAVTREEINDLVEQHVAQGHVKNREQLISWLGEMGEVTRINDKFISLKTDKAERAFRLKGAVFEVGFDFQTGLEQPLVDPRAKLNGDEIELARVAAFEQRREFFERLRARSKKLRAMQQDDQHIIESSEQLIEAFAVPEEDGQEAIEQYFDDQPPSSADTMEKPNIPELQMLDIEVPGRLNARDADVDYWWADQFEQWPERAGMITIIADTHPDAEFLSLVEIASELTIAAKEDPASPFANLLPTLLELAKRTLAGGWKRFKGLARALYRDQTDRLNFQSAPDAQNFRAGFPPELLLQNDEGPQPRLNGNHIDGTKRRMPAASKQDAPLQKPSRLPTTPNMSPEGSPKVTGDNLNRLAQQNSTRRAAKARQSDKVDREVAEDIIAKKNAQQAAQARADQLQDFEDHWMQACEFLPTPSRPSKAGQIFFKPSGFDEQVASGTITRKANLFSERGMEIAAGWEHLKLKAAEIWNIMRKAMIRWVDRILNDLPSKAQSSRSVWHELVGDNQKAVDALTAGLENHSDLRGPFSPLEKAWGERDRLAREQARRDWIADQPARDAAKAEAGAQREALVRKVKEDDAKSKPATPPFRGPSNSM